MFRHALRPFWVGLGLRAKVFPSRRLQVGSILLMHQVQLGTKAVGMGLMGT